MTVAKPRIGFVGVGLMGHGMARNLLAKGFPLAIVGHRNRTPVESLRALGATEAATARELAASVDILFICVTGTPEVEAVIGGESGVLAGARPGLIVIDCSTSEPDSTLRIAAALAEKRATLVDAPLARTPKEAEAGKLNTMVGADAETFARIEPALQACCENIFHVGPLGAGHKLKLIYNFLAMGTAALVAEALAASAKTGVDPAALYKVTSAGGANSGIFQLMVPKALERDFTGLQFAIANARKDLRYYTHMAETAPVVGFLAEAVHQTLVQAVALGYGEKFVPSLIEMQEQINGITIGRG